MPSCCYLFTINSSACYFGFSVCGLPTPNKDHAVQMCRFAIEARARMIHLRGKLGKSNGAKFRYPNFSKHLTCVSIILTTERRLGPDTGDLVMRFGLHSGAVTAGVLRGDRARFQVSFCVQNIFRTAVSIVLLTSFSVLLYSSSVIP